MAARTVSRWARLFVAAGAGFLVAWSVAAVAGAPRRAAVVLGLFGFVLHVAFGKAYSLVPTYFARELATPRAAAAHLPLTVLGTGALALDAFGVGPAALSAVGAGLWTAGVAVFLGAIAWTLRDNPTGAETGTSDANADRRPVDRAANAFVPVALAYLAVGSYATLAAATGLPTPVDGYAPRASHLLGAGAAALLVFAVGLRLLPRFMVAHPPRWLVAVVLPTGAVAPALLAATLPAGRWFRAGAVLEAVAVVGFAVAVAALFVRSDRRRVGFYGVLAAGGAGVLAALVGLSFAFDAFRPALVRLHLRLNLLGFLGLTVVGVSYQFYPPNVGTFPGADDRTALASIVAIAGGLLVETVAVVPGFGTAVVAGRLFALAGAVLYAGLVVGLFHERHWSR